MKLFEVQQAGFSYEEATALQGVDLSIHQNQSIVVLGANGSGKSTLLRLLNGLYFPAQGSVSFCGTRLTESTLGEESFAFEFRRRVGLVFQNPDVQLFNPTVFDEIAFGPLQLRWPSDVIRERVQSTLESLQIGHLKDRTPHRLSGGEKKRVALASVLVLDPDVLLLDEPTAGLDPQSQSRIIDLLVESHGKKTIVTATHDLDIVEDIADYCVVFENGRITAQGPPSFILADNELLRRAHLQYSYRHRHASGEVHSHPHIHRHHEHPR